jgi:hypothetical protein
MQVINLIRYFQKKPLAIRSVLDEDSELSTDNIGFILHGDAIGKVVPKTRDNIDLDEYEQAMVA